jgi:hypothetical protein
MECPSLRLYLYDSLFFVISQLRSSKPPQTSAAGAIEICLRGEHRLLVGRGFDHELLIDLVRTMEATA